MEPLQPTSRLEAKNGDGRTIDPARPTGKVKGSLLIARMKFLRGQGKIPLDEVLKQLSAADREVLQGILLPTSWYENDLVVRLETAMTAVIARGDRARVFAQMGRFSAESNLGPGGVQRPYVREGDPHHLLERVPRMYLAQHSAGHRTYERIGERAAAIRTHDADATVVDDCLMVIGWLQRAIEVSGGLEVRVVETRCRGRGAAMCEYRCSWS